MSSLLGLIWFIFPKTLLNFTKEEKYNLSPNQRYLPQTLAIFTLFTSIISMKAIKKEKVKDKKKILGIKVLCALIVYISLIGFVYFLKRINYYSIISLILLSMWLTINGLGLTV